MYKLLYDNGLKKYCNMIIRVHDNAFIPFDPDNTDYQAYLKWVEEGNTPLPAEDN